MFGTAGPMRLPKLWRRLFFSQTPDNQQERHLQSNSQAVQSQADVARGLEQMCRSARCKLGLLVGSCSAIKRETATSAHAFATELPTYNARRYNFTWKSNE